MERNLILDLQFLALVVKFFGIKMLKTFNLLEDKFSLCFSAKQYLNFAQTTDIYFTISQKLIDDVVRVYVIENLIDRKTTFILEIGDFFEFLEPNEEKFQKNKAWEYVRDAHNNFVAVNWFSLRDYLKNDNEVVRYKINQFYSFSLQENVLISECGTIVHYYYEPKNVRLDYEDENGKNYDTEFYSSRSKALKALRSLKGRYKSKTSKKNKVHLIEDEQIVKTKYING